MVTQISQMDNDIGIPGHLFNTEHSSYLIPMYSLKRHRSMLWKYIFAMQPIKNGQNVDYKCNSKLNFEIILKFVLIDKIGLSG
jgi:hypothetical protein